VVGITLKESGRGGSFRLTLNARVIADCGKTAPSGRGSDQSRARQQAVTEYATVTEGNRSLQLCVFRLGLFEDRDVGVGVFPEGEEFLVGGLCLSLISRQSERST
jgi:hypothetical protein